MPKYILSPQAQKSLKNIRAYSLETFGKKRTNAYLQALRDRMIMLAEAPSKGKERDEIKAGYYSFYEGSHTIYYRIADTHIDIIDILHQKMDPTLHLWIANKDLTKQPSVFR